jgi:MSHA pilin protein MshA
MVIVILGILAATALPKFTSLKTDASNAAGKGIAGALASASAINKAVRSLNAGNGAAVTNCQDVSSALDGGLPSGYTIGSVAVTADGTVQCTVSDGTSSGTFVAHGIT